VVRTEEGDFFMAQDFQSHVVSGNVGSKMESFTYEKKDGTGAVGKRFRLASQNGTNVTWYTVQVYDPRIAGAVEPYLQKGRKVVVTGRLQISIYRDKSGQPAIQLTLNAHGVTFMDTPGQHESQAVSASASADLLRAASLFLA
jgi:single-stranded DNA-binding protein